MIDTCIILSMCNVQAEMFVTLSVHVCFVLLEAMGIVALHACKPAILCGIYIEKNMHVKNAYTKVHGKIYT